ncbi:MAG: glycosyltransferase, partial [Verrucomicrobia bacterium]|nr:glycosyltransferase [Verrucomicrobiota bacterium]
MNCYNGEKYLREAIDSVLAQTYTNWEIIFWDNQSTDSSAEIVNSFNDERIKYYYSENHTILYEARGYAYAKTKGELIAFLDDDDTWSPEKLEKQVGLFENKEIGFVCSNYYNWDSEKNNRVLAFSDTLPGGYVLDELLNQYFIGMLTLVLRRESFESLELQFDPRFHIIGDFDLVIRMASKWKLGVVQSPLACYRIHPENESRKQIHCIVRETLEWYREYEKD